MALLNFDASQVAPNQALEAIPAAWYKVIAEKSEIKPTKAPGGAYLEVTFVVIEGQYTGRKLFSRFNIQNTNPQAQQIGYGQLSAFAHAVGVLQVADSSQLHNIPLQIKTKVRKDTTGEYEDQNEVTKYENINAAVEHAVAAAPAFTVPQPGNMPVAQPPAAGYGAPGYGPPGYGAPPAQAPAAPAQPAWQQPAGQQPWQQPPAAQPPAPPAPPQYAPPQPPAAPQGYVPPAGGPPWGAPPPGAQQGAPQPPAPPQPPHPAQSATPPWQR